MSEKTGFGIELEELRTVGSVFAAAIPAVAMLGLAKDSRQRIIAIALGSAMLIAVSVLNVKLLRKQ